MDSKMIKKIQQDFDKVISGIVKYLEENILSTMNELQDFAVRLAMSRVLNNVDTFKAMLVNNAFVRTFAIIDDKGNVDVDGLYRDIKEQVRAKGKITIKIPMLGTTYRFTEQDVDKLFETIKGER